MLAPTASAAPESANSAVAAVAGLATADKPVKPPKPPNPPKPPKPQKPPKPNPPPKATPPQTDISSGMPRSTRDDLTGDFLGRGYDQRLRAEDTNLNLYDSASHGGGLISQASMDLGLVPSGGINVPCAEIFGCSPAQTWSTDDCAGCFTLLWSLYHLNTIYLAQTSNQLFMTGNQGDTFDEFIPVESGQTAYRNYLYVLPHNGSCASSSCAQQRIRLPDAFGYDPSFGYVKRAITVTSLAATTVGGNTIVAVGLSDGGVQIYGDIGTGSFKLTDTFLGIGAGDGTQTPPTALAFDPSGSGRLSIGVISDSNIGYVIDINGQGNIQNNTVLTWSQTGTGALVPAVFSTAWGLRQDGTPVVAFGTRGGDGRGTIQLVEPTLTPSGQQMSTQATSQSGPGVVMAINPLPRLDGSTGGSDYAVTYQTSPDSTMGVGGLLRWDGTSDGWTPQAVTTGTAPANTLTSDLKDFRKWFPGIKQGRFQISNTLAEPVSVQLYQSPAPGSGCWYAPAWADAPAFPSAAVPVAAKQTSATYTMGAFTAGPNGGCAATDTTGTWRGYLTLTPTYHPADAAVVGLTLGKDLTVDVKDQAGGSTTVSIAQTNPGVAAFGLWTLNVCWPPASAPVCGPPAPTPAPTAPTVNATRLTPADSPATPVYRFDVSNAAYQLAAGNQFGNQVVVPPLLVQGSVNGQSWTTVGTLVPRGAPTTTAGPAATLTLGPSTFWWENAQGGPAYRFIRVGLGTPQSTTQVSLASLTPPADAGSTLGGVSLNGANSGTTVKPVDSGVDEAPVQLAILDPNSNDLPVDNPTYQAGAARVYYRDNNNALVTNLFVAGEDATSFLGVSPYPGAYPNNGSTQGGTPALSDGNSYVATRSSAPFVTLTAYLAIDGTPPAFSASPVSVQGSNLIPIPSAASAATGISLTGCQDTTGSNVCRLFPIAPGQPALYLDTKNGVQVGVLTSAPATSSASHLPLVQTAGTSDHLLQSTPLTVSVAAAQLSDTTGFLQGDYVDTFLVTHGLLASATAPVVAN